MATQPETKIDAAKAEAAAEKAYAAAAGDGAAKKSPAVQAPQAEAAKAEAPKADAPKPETAKIDTAVAQVKAAPTKAAAKKTPAKKAVAKKAPVKAAQKKATRKSAVVKAKPAAKPAARKAAKAANPTVSNVSKLKDKIMATTKTTDFTATIKTAAADAQTKAKAAYDKMQAYAGEMTEFTKGNVEALVELGKILGSGVQTMARGEVEAAKGAFETVTADLKAMAAVKSPTELFKLQGEIARRNFDAAVARYSKNTEVSMKLVNDAIAPLSSRMSVAVEKISKAA